MRSPHEIRRQSQASRTPPHEMCGASQALRILSMKLPRRLRLCRLAEICGTSEALRAPLVDCVKRLGCLCILCVKFARRLRLCAPSRCNLWNVSRSVHPLHVFWGTSQALCAHLVSCVEFVERLKLCARSPRIVYDVSRFRISTFLDFFQHFSNFFPHF